MNGYIIFVILLYLSVSLSQQQFSLDWGSTCKSGCGSFNKPFSSFEEAISELSLTKFDKTPVLLVNKGVYFGENNKAIIINFSIDIIAISSNRDETVIDCEDIDFGFKVLGSFTKFSIQGVTIKNCIAPRGAALLTENYFTKIDNVVFRGNKARQGSAIFSSSSNILIKDSYFLNNSNDAVEMENGFGQVIKSFFYGNEKDIVCTNSSVSNINSEFGSTCTYCTILNENRDNICQSRKRQDLCNSNGECDEYIEDYQNCPSDCQYYDQVEALIEASDIGHPGWKLQSFKESLPKPINSTSSSPTAAETLPQVDYLEYAKVSNFMGQHSSQVSGILSSFIQVTKSGDYSFRLKQKNLIAIMFVNSRVLFDNFFEENVKQVTQERRILLSNSQPHHIIIHFNGVNDMERDLELEFRYGDHGPYTLVPSIFITIAPNMSCGDDICNEDPTSCLIDCYDHIEKDCPAQSPPADIQSYYGPIRDTLGALLNNQYIFSLPGLNYLSHGMNIQTHEISPSPVFSITYCDNTSFSLVHSPSRGLAYSVPPGIYAQMSPKCTMDTTTKTYSTSSQMAYESSLEMDLDVSASGSVGGWLGHLSVSASLSLSESTQKAGETQGKKDGSISKTELKCQVSKAHVEEPKFHTKFIQDIGNSNGVDKASILTKFRKLIQKYGSIYFKSITLGGKLEQMSVVEHSFSSSKSSSEVERSMEMSFAVQASSKILPVGGSVSLSGSMDSKTSSTEQNQFENNSSRSTLTVYGGEPGSYGDEKEPNSFAKWASTVDQIPYPIDYQVGFIADVIPKEWILKNGFNVQELWREAEFQLYKDLFIAAKTSKYLDEPMIHNMGRNHTVYLVEYDKQSCQFTTFKLEVESPTGLFHYNFTLSQSTGATILPLEYDDRKGIKSLSFSEYYSPFTCQTIKMFNLVTSRSYHFVPDPTVPNKYILKQPEPNSVIVEFQGTNNVNTEFITEIQFIGTTGVVKKIVLNFSEKLSFVIDYFGDLVGLSFTFITNYENQNLKKDFIFTFSSIRVTQACPYAEKSSPCILKNMDFIPSDGFAKTFEVWSRESDKITLTYSNKPHWVSITPIGR
ncbi:hypothetical protein CYY_008557 [Polysphondylium violaceum]|uniref:MACPF domain-containing protein n=1 Tax=Polysphondylium violaceum TaxID=133409 RepID=A0A8J4V156_9MYCE|nr:hypothetical protein CYY_008557 [Polysphondylium violaceum]